MDSLSCDAMGKSFPQSNFGQINVGIKKKAYWHAYDSLRRKIWLKKILEWRREEKKGNGMWRGSKVMTHIPQQFDIFSLRASAGSLIRGCP